MRGTITTQWAYDNMEDPSYYEDGPECEICRGDEDHYDGLMNGFQDALRALETALDALASAGSSAAAEIQREYDRLMEVEI